MPCCPTPVCGDLALFVHDGPQIENNGLQVSMAALGVVSSACALVHASGLNPACNSQSRSWCRGTR